MAARMVDNAKKKAARCLFGKPDPEEVSRRLNSSLEHIYDEETNKWNFDFSGGVPLVGAHGEYEFESVSASEVPRFYREKRLCSRKTIGRRDSSPVSDTVPTPDSPLLLVEPNEVKLFVACTSKDVADYEKPVTRSSSTKRTDAQSVETLKQTKLTNYMPVRKRRSNNGPAIAPVSCSATTLRTAGFQKERRGIHSINKTKVVPKRTLRLMTSNIPKKVQSPVLVTAVVSPRSPPPKKMTVSTRRHRRSIGTGDF